MPRYISGSGEWATVQGPRTDHDRMRDERGRGVLGVGRRQKRLLAVKQRLWGKCWRLQTVTNRWEGSRGAFESGRNGNGRAL